MRTYEELKALIEKRGVHPLLGGTGENNFHIEQNPHELAIFLVAMEEFGVKTVLELGTGWRAGLARFLSEDMGWRVVSVDKDMPQATAPKVEFLQGSTAILAPLFHGAQFDLVIIDAGNTYEDVQHDYEHYAPLATKAVAICKIEGLRGCEGVYQFWNEPFIGVLNCHAIIENSDQRSGIGWIEIAKEETKPIFDRLHEAIEEDWQLANPEEVARIATILRDKPDDDLDTIIHEPVIVEEDNLPKPVAKPKSKPTKRPRKQSK